jgi:hypothetical protein
VGQPARLSRPATGLATSGAWRVPGGRARVRDPR